MKKHTGTNDHFEVHADPALIGKRVAILATDGFEEHELFEPLHALQKAGLDVDIISLESGKIRAWKDGDWSRRTEVDQTVDMASADDYEALVLPGGVMNPDQLRTDAGAVDFVKKFAAQEKLIAAICHGPWLLIETGLLNGREVTSWKSLKTDLENAGAHWVDQAVVQDRNWITSRQPEDLPAFNEALLKALSNQVATKTRSGLKVGFDRSQRIVLESHPQTEKAG